MEWHKVWSIISTSAFWRTAEPSSSGKQIQSRMIQQSLGFYSSIEIQNKKSSENIHRRFWPLSYSRFQTTNCNRAESPFELSGNCVMWSGSFRHTKYNGIITRIGQKVFSLFFSKVSQDFLIYSLFISKRKQNFTKIFRSSHDRFAVRAWYLKEPNSRLRLWVRVSECKFWHHKEPICKFVSFCLKGLVKHLFFIRYIF